MPPAPRLTLYVCELDEDGPKSHACRRAGESLRFAGHNFLKIVVDGPKSKRIELTGQSQLPAMRLIDGTTMVVGSGPIAAWADAHDRTTIGKPVPQPGAPSGRSKEEC